MKDIIGLLISLVVIAVVVTGPLLFYYLIGRYIERKHYESIKEREAKYINIPVIPSDDVDSEKEIARMTLVAGSCVISSDKFKRFAAGLTNLIGGRVSSYESLLDRARREAILRMKEEAVKKIRAEAIVNFRLESMSICGGRSGAKSMGIVEMLAYGTAISYKEPS